MADEKTPPLALVPSATEPPTPLEEPTWEDDETQTTGVLRALFVCLAGGLLLLAQWNAPAGWIGTIGQNWSRWIATAFAFNLVLPLGLIWMFFGQGLTTQPWLKDPRHNAWNYGWNFKDWKRHFKIALVLWGVMLPFLIYFSRNLEIRASYALYLPAMTSPGSWAYLVGTLVLYMFCWEWFFRGFALFGVAQGFGPLIAITIQAVAFGLAHAGKPPVEMWSAFAGGAILGVVCWHEKSFFPAFLIHALVHVSWAVLVLSTFSLPF